MDGLETRFVFGWVPCKLKHLLWCIILKFSLAIAMLHSIEQKEHLSGVIVGNCISLFLYHVTALTEKIEVQQKNRLLQWLNFPLSFIWSFTSDMVKYT